MAAQSPDDARWKHKYYGSLEETERQEQHWRRVEATLNRALGRLALAAYGADAAVDKRLDALRDAIRAGGDAERLAELVAKVHRACERAGIATRPPTERTPTRELRDLLLGTLAEIPFPRKLEARARKLCTRLASDEDDADLRSLVAQVNELLRTALSAEPDASTPSPDPPTRSWVGRFLSARGEAQAPGPEPAALARELVDGFLDRVHHRLGSGSDIDDLRRRVADADARALARLLAEVADLAYRERDAPCAPMEAAADETDRGSSQPLLALDEVLQELIGALDLPEDLQERRDALRERLEAPLTAKSLPDLVGAVAALVGELNARTRSERAQMQAFLTSVTDRLQELDTFFARHRETDDEAHRAGQTLRASVRQEVHDIEREVSNATDLDRLKQDVQSRLAAIEHHMTAFLENEDRRHQRSQGEITYLAKALSRTQSETDNLRARLEQAQARAMRDGLTGLYNRAAFDERIEQEHARWARHGETLSVLIWDLDHFKALNDSLGHQAGDKILRAVAQSITKRVRASDFVARYGGEEFVALLPATDAEGARELADAVRTTVADTAFRYRGKRVAVTLSCGVAAFHDDDEPDTVLGRADGALYRAKNNGRNRVEVESRHDAGAPRKPNC